MLKIEKGISRTKSIESATLDLGNGNIRDIKLYSTTMLILWAVDSKFVLG